MKAMDKIKEIERIESENHVIINEAFGKIERPAVFEDLVFILKAFKVMREIAIGEWSQQGRWAYGEEEVDRIFDERMAIENPDW